MTTTIISSFIELEFAKIGISQTKESRQAIPGKKRKHYTESKKYAETTYKKESSAHCRAFLNFIQLL